MGAEGIPVGPAPRCAPPGARAKRSTRTFALWVPVCANFESASLVGRPLRNISRSPFVTGERPSAVALRVTQPPHGPSPARFSKIERRPVAPHGGLGARARSRSPGGAPRRWREMRHRWRIYAQEPVAAALVARWAGDQPGATGGRGRRFGAAGPRRRPLQAIGLGAVAARFPARRKFPCDCGPRASTCATPRPATPSAACFLALAGNSLTSGSTAAPWVVDFDAGGGDPTRPIAGPTLFLRVPRQATDAIFAFWSECQARHRHAGRPGDYESRRCPLRAGLNSSIPRTRPDSETTSTDGGSQRQGAAAHTTRPARRPGANSLASADRERFLRKNAVGDYPGVGDWDDCEAYDLASWDLPGVQKRTCGHSI
jgi:hypothetical protein